MGKAPERVSLFGFRDRIGWQHEVLGPDERNYFPAGAWCIRSLSDFRVLSDLGYNDLAGAVSGGRSDIDERDLYIEMRRMAESYAFEKKILFVELGWEK